MRSARKGIVFLSVLWLCFSAVDHSRAVTVPDKPDRYVVDLAGVVDDSVEAKLNGFLQELEQKTSAQLVILTIESLDGEAIEDFSIRVAHDKWKLGQKDKDNGVLLLVSVKDRKYRIEVGYGLERVLPDSLVGSIGRDEMVLFFKKGDFSTGIYAATLALANTIAADAAVKITGMPEGGPSSQTDGSRKPTGTAGSIISFLIFFLVFIFFMKNPRNFLLFFLLSSMGGGARTWRGGYGRGTGFGGGGFGSFGGGGGGGFGGGGASGGW